MDDYLTWPSLGFIAIFLGALLIIVALNMRSRGKLGGEKPGMALAFIVGIFALFGLGGFILAGLL